ncbi:unnamed protein product [Adineta ricciae]|uniref:Carrier domain-containing protein n=2 Tax=Adineta ricciae TaxID=249248 RepID=A0A814W2A7_ADIRI|nr:unnamed protein product [Adineta ricciae]
MKISFNTASYLLNNPEIHNCVVMKVIHDLHEQEYLVAYVHVTIDDFEKHKNEIEKQIKVHCQQNLPSYMIPSFFIVMKEFPLNQNGKVDRKQLPKIDRALLIDGKLESDNKNINTKVSSPLEQVLWKIFVESFGIPVDTNKINTDISFSALGASSLHAMKALTLIRQRIYPQMDFRLLFANPTVRQLSNILEPLISSNIMDEKAKVESQNGNLVVKNELQQQRLKPSLSIETCSVVLLALIYISPVLGITQLHPFSSLIFNIMFYLITIPSLHLMQYILISRLLFPFGCQQEQNEYQLFSWTYYRRWFLQRLWFLNTSYLSILLGTSFYNLYLRLCGANIGQNTHVLTTLIDVPELIDIGDSVFIGKDVFLCNILYHQKTFQLTRIIINNNCTIDAESVLYGNVEVKDKVLMKSMSSVTGLVLSNSIIDGQNTSYGSSSCMSNLSNSHQLTKFKTRHTLYQFLCIVMVLLTHTLSIYCGYLSSFTFKDNIGVLFGSIIYLLLSMSMALVFFFILIGNIQSCTIYKMDTFGYLHKIWFRNLITNTFIHSFSILPKTYHHYLSAVISKNVEIGITMPDSFIGFPGSPNLIQIDDNVTVSCDYLLMPTEMTHEQECVVNKIHLTENVFLGSMVTIQQGALIEPNTTIGSLTRITALNNISTINNNHTFFLGIPGESIPLTSLSARTSNLQSFSKLPNYKYWFNIWKINTMFYFKYICSLLAPIILISICNKSIDLSSYTTIICNVIWNLFLFILFIFYCAITCLYDEKCRRFYQENNEYTYNFKRLPLMNVYHANVIDQFLSGTQWIVFLLRFMGAKIGNNLIVNDFFSITDPQLTEINDDVRIYSRAIIQASYF